MDKVIETKSQMIMRIAKLSEQNEQLQAENERLKEENEELCGRMAEVTYRATGGRLSYPNYTLDAIEQAFYDQLEILSDQKSETYRQALQEIREELEEDITCESRECGCDDYGECLNCLKETILTKINEVIGVE